MTMKTHLHSSPAIGVLLVASGLGINYLLNRHNILKVWENSTYPISLADMFYPPICFLLLVSGAVMVIDVKLSIRPHSFSYALGMALPLAALYALWFFGLQFVQTGADRLGECSGLDAAAASTKVIPHSKAFPGRPAVGCAVERRGIFLSYYNDIAVFGVTDHSAQEEVLDSLRGEYRKVHTHPLRVRFFDEENWTEERGKNGVSFGHSGPQKLLRVANVG